MKITANSKELTYRDNSGELVNIMLKDDNIWLSLSQMAELFQRDKSVISRHIKNIFKEGELLKISTVAKFATVQFEGDREIVRDVDYYNLDIIISVGYRVKSLRGTQFRIWANSILKEYLLSGYAIRPASRHELDELRTELKNRLDEIEQQIDNLDIAAGTQISEIQASLIALCSKKQEEKPRVRIGYKTLST